MEAKNLRLRHFWKITNLLLSRDRTSVPNLLNGLKVISLVKAKLFVMNFTTNSMFDNMVHSLPDFLHLTEFKIRVVSVMALEVSRHIKSLNSMKGTCSDKIAVVVLKNFNPKLS